MTETMPLIDLSGNHTKVEDGREIIEVKLDRNTMPSPQVWRWVKKPDENMFEPDTFPDDESEHMLNQIVVMAKDIAAQAEHPIVIPPK